jgi:DNA-binding beta-propeller fold protein YncE
MSRLTFCISQFTLLFLASASTLQADHAFVVTTDYITGGSATMDIESPWTVFDDDVQPACSDAIVRTFRNHHFVINRFGCDNIQVIDVPTLDTVAEFSVGPLANPQDIVEISSAKAYVTRYESEWLYIVHPTIGTVIDSISLGMFADGDGLPEMSMMARDGNRVFVQIQRLDRDNFYNPDPPSYLAVIDSDTDTLVDVDPATTGVQAIELSATNPSGKMQIDSDARRLYVTCSGRFGVLDGGVDVIDLDNLVSMGLITTEAQLGNDMSCGRVVVDAGIGYALVSGDFFFTTSLARFDLATGDWIDFAFTTEEFVPCIAYDRFTEQIFFPDRFSTAPGMRVFDALTGAQLTATPRSTGLPPFDVTFYREPVVDVADGTPNPPRPLILAAPNPTSGSTTLRAGEALGPIRRAAVYDVRGRLIREFADIQAARDLRWDGTDHRGRAVAAGLYFVRVDDGVQVAESRIVIRR